MDNDEVNNEATQLNTKDRKLMDNNNPELNPFSTSF